MSTLQKALRDYLSMRRGLGFKLTYDGAALSKFVLYLESKGMDHITKGLALDWCQNGNVRPATKKNRLTCVRGFARYLSASDSRNEIPSHDLLRVKRIRPRPYLYTDREIELLLDAALDLHPVNGLRHLTYYSLIGLIAVTGLRLGEAIKLQVEDVDLENGILTIRGAKFGKSRLVPLHDTTTEALLLYKHSRDQIVKNRSCSAFFIGSRYKPLCKRVVEKTFDSLSRQVGLREDGQNTGPRIHDLRHRMAVQTLLRWYRDGDDPQRQLPLLSTYLGHVCIGNTYWYLTASPELLGEAAKRLEQQGR